MTNRCPACGADDLHAIYSIENIPVHSVRLVWSRQEALDFPTGKLDLVHCETCGFIYNQSYNPDLQDYSAEYESTQAYSPMFNAFADQLAAQLVERYHLYGKDIIEIGCGQGEFLALLCEKGGSRGTGFDPAFDRSRSPLPENSPVQVIADYYSEKYTGQTADFVACKMTLEHIRDVSSFVGTVRRALGDRSGTRVFFQVPDVKRVLEEVAFWDIYYEHCSYFSLGSIARLFRQEGFNVHDLWRGYGDQYLMIEASPADGPTRPSLPQENDLDEIKTDVARFTEQLPYLLRQWKQTVQSAVERGEKVVLWGSGSKGVAFLTTLGLCDEIEYTVDINPNKHGTYMVGTGQKVVSPEFMAEYRPDLVILMNPLYRAEVRDNLARHGLSPRIIAVGE